MHLDGTPPEAKDVWRGAMGEADTQLPARGGVGRGRYCWIGLGALLPRLVVLAMSCELEISTDVAALDPCEAVAVAPCEPFAGGFSDPNSGLATGDARREVRSRVGGRPAVIGVATDETTEDFVARVLA